MVCLQLIPFGSFEWASSVDLATAQRRASRLAPIQWEKGADNRINVDGVRSQVVDLTNRSISAYTQLYRSGIIETCSRLGSYHSPTYREGDRQIQAAELLVNTLKAFRRLIALQRILGVSPPIHVAMSLVGVDGYELVSSRQTSGLEAIDRHELTLPGSIVFDFQQRREDILKPIFDGLWNAFGVPRCLDYDDKGNLTLGWGLFQDEVDWDESGG